ncbi:MAG: hypothetical protein JW822_14375 [Spirochaetales bacterium]|nr:hypothetical protein [Spirochaetales bacterium]
MKRETISYERVLYFIGNISPMYFAFRIKVKGSVKKQGLEQALLKLQRRHPLARVRVEMTPDKKQFITDENVPAIPVTEYASDQTDWKSLIKRELQTPFDIYKGPMIRIHLIREQDTSDIVAVFHHALCDGLSAVQFLQEMFVFMSDPNPALKPYAEAPNFATLIKDDILEIIKTRPMPPWLKNKDYLKVELKPRKEEPFPQPNFAIHNWSLGEQETGNIVKQAKHIGISVHALLGAIILKAFAREFGEKDGYLRKLQSPLSFKPFLKAEAQEYFGLFNGLLTKEVDCSPERPLPEIAKQIYTELTEKIENYIPLDGYYYFNTYFLRDMKDPELYYANRPTPPMDYDVSLSNLGRVRMQKVYDDLEIEELYGPIFSAIRGERVIGVNTFRDRMFFTCIYDRDCFDHDAGTRIIEQVKKMLRDIDR